MSPRMKAGNVGATFFAAYVPGRYATQKTAADYARKVIRSIRNDIIARTPTHSHSRALPMRLSQLISRGRSPL